MKTAAEHTLNIVYLLICSALVLNQIQNVTQQFIYFSFSIWINRGFQHNGCALYIYFEILFRTKMNIPLWKWSAWISFERNKRTEQWSWKSNDRNSTESTSSPTVDLLPLLFTALTQYFFLDFVFSSFIFSFVDVAMYVLRFSAFDFVCTIYRYSEI